MKNLSVLVFLTCCLLLPGVLFAFEAHWQDGRIVYVEAEHNGKVLYWIANTPVTKNNDVTYRISVHVKDELYTGTYAPGQSQVPPPKQWVKNYPIKVEISGSTMLLQTPTGETLKAGGLKWKSVARMKPIKPEEWGAQAAKPEAASQVESLVGFSKPAAESSPPAATKSGDAPAPDANSTPTVDESPATLSVSSSPYLADIYIDGKLEGYTPAKLTLSPGKHAVRLEKQGYKAWSTDVTLKASSQSSVDATLTIGRR
jgi:PEGA domain